MLFYAIDIQIVFMTQLLYDKFFNKQMILYAYAYML